jgi:hypothetical protein
MELNIIAFVEYNYTKLQRPVNICVFDLCRSAVSNPDPGCFHVQTLLKFFSWPVNKNLNICLLHNCDASTKDSIYSETQHVNWDFDFIGFSTIVFNIYNWFSKGNYRCKGRAKCPPEKTTLIKFHIFGKERNKGKDQMSVEKEDIDRISYFRQKNEMKINYLYSHAFWFPGILGICFTALSSSCFHCLSRVIDLWSGSLCMLLLLATREKYRICLGKQKTTGEEYLICFAKWEIALFPIYIFLSKSSLVHFDSFSNFNIKSHSDSYAMSGKSFDFVLCICAGALRMLHKRDNMVPTWCQHMFRHYKEPKPWDAFWHRKWMFKIRHV